MKGDEHPIPEHPTDTSKIVFDEMSADEVMCLIGLAVFGKAVIMREEEAGGLHDDCIQLMNRVNAKLFGNKIMAMTEAETIRRMVIRDNLTEEQAIYIIRESE